MAKRKVPEDLSPAGLAWYKCLVTEYAIEDSASLLAIEACVRAFDRMNECRKILDSEGVVIVDRFGQKRQHPAAAIERDSRAALIQGLKALGLNDEV